MGGFNCNHCISPDQPPGTWTCPCGLGYWDGRKKEFITGGRVRRGEAQTRADYDAHLLQCPSCRAQAEQDGLSPLPGPAPRDRAQTQYFLPGEGIDPEVITKYIDTYLGADASVSFGENPSDGRPGYIILADTAITTKMISDLLYLSQQKRETPRDAKVDAPGGQGSDQRVLLDHGQDPKHYRQPGTRSRSTQYSKARNTQSQTSPKSDSIGSPQRPLNPEADWIPHSQDPPLSTPDLADSYQGSGIPYSVPASYQQEYYQQSQSFSKSNAGGYTPAPIYPTAPTSYPQNLSPHSQDYRYVSPITSTEQRSRQPYIPQTQSSTQPSLFGNYQNQDEITPLHPQHPNPGPRGLGYSESSLSSDLQDLSLEHPAMDTAPEDPRGDLEQSRSNRQGKDSRRPPQDSKYRKAKDRDRKDGNRKSR